MKDIDKRDWATHNKRVSSIKSIKEEKKKKFFFHAHANKHARTFMQNKLKNRNLKRVYKIKLAIKIGKQ